MQVRGISIWAALRIPGVIMFAATLFCSKLVAYVFLYWLPYYLNAIPVGGKRLRPQACVSPYCLDFLLGYTIAMEACTPLSTV